VAVAPAASAHAGHGLIVATDKGLIEGTYAQGTDQFLGIPYAAPPTGALRWAGDAC
jgi:para-nitrobenzyl esterase